MSEKPALVVDFCNDEAARYAVKHWHYSRSLPAFKRVRVGAWEDDRFVGAVVFGIGANSMLGHAYGLTQFETSELARVALNSNRKTPTSRIVSLAVKLFSRQSPGVRLLVSYADCDQAHIGTIYQAMNWVYVGRTQTGGGTPKFKVNGKVLHGRQVHSLWGTGAQQIGWLRKHIDPKAEKVFTLGKEKYLLPLDRAMRRQIEPLAQPYPKREVQYADG